MAFKNEIVIEIVTKNKLVNVHEIVSEIVSETVSENLSAIESESLSIYAVEFIICKIYAKCKSLI